MYNSSIDEHLYIILDRPFETSKTMSTIQNKKHKTHDERMEISHSDILYAAKKDDVHRNEVIRLRREYELMHVIVNDLDNKIKTNENIIKMIKF